VVLGRRSGVRRLDATPPPRRREARLAGNRDSQVILSAADPLNLTGIWAKCWPSSGGRWPGIC